jgi:acetyltransferase-like isoleucine patch superfamily enzyme
MPSMTANYLWRHRLRERPFTRAWAKVWAKRIWTFHQLAWLLLKRLRYQMGGVKIGLLADLSGARLQGRWSNLEIGDGSFVGRADIQLLNTVVISQNVVINDDVRILTGSHVVESPIFETVTKPVIIMDFAWVCSGATILPGVTIGRGAVVAAGAVVSKDLAPYSVVAGNPAKHLKSRGCVDFHYRPNFLRACYEAWVGRPMVGSMNSEI